MTKTETDRKIVDNITKALIAAGIIRQEDFSNGTIQRVN